MNEREVLNMPTDGVLIQRLRFCGSHGDGCIGCDIFNPDDDSCMDACNQLLNQAAMRIESLIRELDMVAERAKREPVKRECWIEVSREQYRQESYFVPTIEEKCSGCGRHVYRYETEPADEFCPTCGAIMERKETCG